MDLKHSPPGAFHQAARADCLRRWYARPQGRRVQQELGRQLGSLRLPRFGDAWLEVAPLGLLRPEWTGPAWVVRVGSGADAVSAEPDRLPLAAESFSCVLLAHMIASCARAEDAIAEAARVLASEGYLFLLEGGDCPLPGQRRLRARLPVGLQRRNHRRWLSAVGLEVCRQVTLSVAPARLPESWQRRIGTLDVLAAPWLPIFGTCVLTVARRRDVSPLRLGGARLRWAGMSVRAGGSSQWA